MTHRPTGPKRPVELLLSEDLVREVADKVEDLSEFVEQSLCRLVELRNGQPGTNDQAYYDEMVDMGNKFYEKHGVWGEEFSTL
jgi:Post-segregation antitoxin CcdA